jgi:hypothetical protein
MAFLAELDQAGAEPPEPAATIPEQQWPSARPVIGVVPIRAAVLRGRMLVQGTVVDVGPRAWQGGTVLECVIDDGTGRISLALVGRRAIAGLEPGAAVRAEGVVCRRWGRPIILNPFLTLLVPGTT